jgi:hypothetical protein
MGMKVNEMQKLKIALGKRATPLKQRTPVHSSFGSITKLTTYVTAFIAAWWPWKNKSVHIFRSLYSQ